MTASNKVTQEFVSMLHSQLESLFSDYHSGINPREDSRAFGAMVEKKISDQWQSICMDINSEPLPRPGRRTIYDFGVCYSGNLFGVDVKTKDLDSKSYSDGGVCSIANLLKFLVDDHATFIIIEFGHSKVSLKSQLRSLEYIKVAPFHLLPQEEYRIENLGTGQLRLNSSINQIYDKIDWNRTLKQFLDIFTDIAINHYQTVGKTAQKRIDKIKRFRSEGYKSFSNS